MMDPQAMQIRRPKSLSDLAAERIRNAIIRGHFDLGASLSEAELTKSLGISKTPIREALAALRLQGLVELVPQRGAFVFCLGPDEVGHLCRYRFMLETNALDLALKTSRESLLSDLSRICEEMEVALQSHDLGWYLKLDAEFHETFFLHCGNDFLHDGYRSVSDIVATLRTHLSQAPDRTKKSFEEHLRILQLVGDGQIAKAKTVLRKQITRGERAYSELSRNGVRVDSRTSSEEL